MAKKLSIGTLFSGIGAIEHALTRMDLDYNIVFACDNGDIDLSLFDRPLQKEYKTLQTKRGKRPKQSKSP